MRPVTSADTIARWARALILLVSATGTVSGSQGRCPVPCYAVLFMPRVLRLVPRRKPRPSLGQAYSALLIGLLVIISGCLILTIGLYLFAR